MGTLDPSGGEGPVGLTEGRDGFDSGLHDERGSRDGEGRRERVTYDLENAVPVV